MATGTDGAASRERWALQVGDAGPGRQGDRAGRTPRFVGALFRLHPLLDHFFTEQPVLPPSTLLQLVVCGTDPCTSLPAFSAALPTCGAIDVGVICQLPAPSVAADATNTTYTATFAAT